MKKTPIWEDIILILAIFTLWPSIIHRETLLSKFLLFLALFVCIFILVRRIKRFSSNKKNE